MSNLPIGVFDSGVGGLTVLRALIDSLPHERFIYLGDTARLPYGTKSPDTIERYSVQAAGALAARGVKCLVIACNTASAVGLAAIREWAGRLPVIGVLEPGAAAACAASRSGRIAVVATESTVRGAAYQRAIMHRRPDAKVTAIAAQLFVALAEEGLNEGPIAEQIARHYLGSLFREADHNSEAPDTLVLGCTHFPMLIEPIRQAVGQRVSIVDSAATTAYAVSRQLSAAGIESTAQSHSVRFLATDGPERFARVGARFLGRNIEPHHVERIDL